MYRQRSIPKEGYQKLAIAVRVLQTAQKLVISRCCFEEDGREMYKDSNRTCTAIVLLIKPFVWWRSRSRRRRGLLKLPNDIEKHVTIWTRL